jgi:sporulation integral membrane protein YlbJ
MNGKMKSLLFAAGATFLAVALLQNPKESLSASLRGLDLWWTIVFPSLLPFFIISELLIAFGVVRFLGVLAEPVMRPLFNVPGNGSFVWAMGMASGYPAGAKLTARLRQEKQLTRVEAERLVSFTNASNPLFIIAAIAVGFFHDEKLGILLALSHYGGNFFVGLTMRFYRRHEPNSTKMTRNFSFKRALSQLHITRIKDRRPFGKILGDAVIHSLQTLLMVGGFIIIFSVISHLLYIMNITPMIAKGISYFLSIFGLSENLTLPLITGLFEITNGADLTSQTNADLLQQIIIVSFVLGFNGFSIQAQVASILAETDIRFMPYFVGRLLHGVFAVILVILLYKPIYLSQKEESLPYIPSGNTLEEESFWEMVGQVVQMIGPLFTMFSLLLGCLLLTKRLHRN